MADNNMIILMGLGMVGLWFMNRQRGSEEQQAQQLTGASMMAAGEGTSPDAPLQAVSPVANPFFFFNQAGEMNRVPGTNVPLAASSGEDIGVYPGTRLPVPELNFIIQRNPPATGTSDVSPTTPAFVGDPLNTSEITSSSVWDNPRFAASANFMPTLAIQPMDQGIKILGANVDIATLKPHEGFRAFDVVTGDDFTTDPSTMALAIEAGYFTAPTRVTNPPVLDPVRAITAINDTVSQTAYDITGPGWGGAEAFAGERYWAEG